MGWGLISLVLVDVGTTHIHGNPVNAGTVHVYRSPVNVGNVHAYGSMQTEVQIPRKSGGHIMPPWML